MTIRSRHLALVEPPARAAEPSVSEADRRSNARRPLSELPWLDKARLKYGPTVKVIDLSCTGVQIETAGFRLQPGGTVVVEITGDESGFTIPANVLRCQVSGISPDTIYRGGLAFKHSIRLPDDGRATDDAGDTNANPFHEHARLSLALNRRSASGANGSVRTAKGVTAVEADLLASALTMMETPAARQAGAPFARELSRLFRMVTQGVEQRAAEDVLIGQVAEQLRRAVPARMIRLVKGTSGQLANDRSVSFDVPSDGDPTVVKLLVDFPPGSRMQDWHFQYLKAAAHLIGLVRNLERRQRPERDPANETKGAVETELPSGWHRLVVRYTDGRLLKGYSREFAASSGSLHVWPKPDAPPIARITVPLWHVKAVFFVRDFDGDPVHVSRDDPGSGGHGRPIAVTFLDGETLLGTTLNYNQEAVGFFVRPLDASSNNVRIFVASRAIRHVQFP